MKQQAHRKGQYSRKAFLSAFPTKESFAKFRMEDLKENRGRALRAVISNAFNSGIIKKKTGDALQQFIENNQNDLDTFHLPSALTYDDVIGELAGSQSVNSLILRINRIAEDLHIAPFKASMFTRLRKEYHINTHRKRLLIRVLSFYIGNRHRQQVWNYENLLKLPRTLLKDGIEEEVDGIRIAFSIQGQGASDQVYIDWLAAEIRNTIKELKLFHLFGRQISQDLTTMSLNLPRQEGAAGELRLYSRPVCDAFALAHQIIVKWDLFGHSSGYRKLIVAVSGGELKQLDKIQLPMLLEKMDKHPIRLTEFVYHCAKIADLKVVFNDAVQTVEAIDGVETDIHTVDFFWFRYFDFIQVLLTDDLLPTSQEGYELFCSELDFPERHPETRHKALSVLRRLPHNTLLGIEVAKVLMARRMHRESNQILSIILASQPDHLGARVFKINNLVNLGFCQSSLTVFLSFYRLALEESRFIEENCRLDGESLIEIGMLHYGKARYLLHYLRKNCGDKIICGSPDFNTLKEDTINSFGMALQYFERSTVLSQVNVFSIFWIIITRTLLDILKENPALFSSDGPFVDRKQILAKTALETAIVFGWVNLDGEGISSLTPEKLDKYAEYFFSGVRNFENTVQFKPFIPTLYYGSAMVLWDHMPKTTLSIANMVIAFMSKARTAAEELNKYSVGGFSPTACTFRIQDPDHMIDCMDRSADKVKSFIEKYTDEPGAAEQHIPKPDSEEMIFMHFNELFNMRPIFREQKGLS